MQIDIKSSNVLSKKLTNDCRYIISTLHTCIYGVSNDGGVENYSSKSIVISEFNLINLSIHLGENFTCNVTDIVFVFKTEFSQLHFKAHSINFHVGSIILVKV